MKCAKSIQTLVAGNHFEKAVSKKKVE